MVNKNSNVPTARSSGSTSGSSGSSGRSHPSYPHLVWAGGHLTVLTCSLWSIASVLTFKGTPSRLYYLAYLGALTSWGVVVYKSLGVPSLNRAWLSRASMDENVQYFCLALFWWFNKPILVTLLPFLTFSLFHSLTFVRTSLLPKPPSTSSREPPTTLQRASRLIHTWVKQNYESAMQFVAMVEVVVVLGRVILGAVSFRNSFITPFIFAHFLRLRYYLSPQTRNAFSFVSDFLDEQTKSPSCPPIIRNGFLRLRELVKRYGESTNPASTRPAQQAQAQAQAAAAAAGQGSARAKSPNPAVGQEGGKERKSSSGTAGAGARG